ncbi:MAG: Holliday junction resolvase RuvX [Phototrophicales bacterium]|nr:MAG: Holliday junction resolvase RuvX [Phototrophicales bacterium]
MTDFPTKGRLLGLDHGLKRIGVAVCDDMRITARELTIITRQSKKADFEALAKIAQEQGVVGIVIGLPLDLDKTEGDYTRADTVRLWASRLAEVVPLPITFWDEQFSSVDAQDIAKQKRRKPTDPIDDLSARVILQRYLDEHIG